MYKSKKIACVIPARLNSTRFPKKVLASLKGKPLIQWVWEAALACKLFDEVVIAVDAVETAEVVASFGGNYRFTATNCPSGTHRIIELLDSLDAEVIVNWQGDEPFIHVAMIEDLLQSCDNEQEDLWTLRKRLSDEAQIRSPQIVKVVVDSQGQALYFSRAPIPFYRELCDLSEQEVYKHIGIYAYSKESLYKIAALPSCLIEEAEKLEQLRFLYHGLKVRVHETRHETVGIDLLEHLFQAEVFIDSCV